MTSAPPPAPPSSDPPPPVEPPAWAPPPPHPGSDRGYLKLYIDEVLGADQGCDFAFCLPPVMRQAG